MRTKIALTTTLSLACATTFGSLALHAQTTESVSPSPAVTDTARSATPSDPAQQATVQVGDYVRTLAGGPTMQVRSIAGDQVICDVPSPNGTRQTASFPVAQLTVVQRPGDREPPLVEPAPYKPCPANVIKDGHHECRG